MTLGIEVGERAVYAVAGCSAVVGTRLGDTHQLTGEGLAVAPHDVDACRGSGDSQIGIIGIEDAFIVCGVDERAVRVVGRESDDMVGVRVKGVAAAPKGAAYSLAVVDVAVAGVDVHEDGDVVDPEVALSHRVVLAGSNNVLNVSHLIHDVEVVIIPSSIHRIVIHSNLVHSPLTIDTGVVVRNALSDQHRGLPVALVAVHGDGLALAVAVVGVGGVVAADRVGGAAVGSGAYGRSLLVGEALVDGAEAVGRADIQLYGGALGGVCTESQVDGAVDSDMGAVVDGVPCGGGVGYGDRYVDGALEAAALFRDADDRHGVGAVVAPCSCRIIIELVAARICQIVCLTAAVEDHHNFFCKI